MSAFQGQRAFITGGSSGIGLALARLLVDAGAHVAIGARTEARLAEALAALQARARDGQRVASVVVDVADRDSVAGARPRVLEALGGLDMLVNNAGIAHPARFQDTPDDVFDAMLRVNYMGTVHVTRAFVDTLVAQGSGHVVNVSSIVGFLGIYGYTAYAASKHAVVGFSECLRQELAERGVQVHIVFPGDTDTPQLAAENRIKPPETKAIAGKVDTLSPEAVARAILDGVARGRLHILPGGEARFTHFAYRHAPWLVRWTTDRALKRYRKDHPLGR